MTSKAVLWLTYAWVDNKDLDVDFLIQKLEESIEVRFDRRSLIAGRRLWHRIAKNISDPAVDAWAIFLTRASLESPACMEELDYALDRALGTRGPEFPLIAIVADAPFDQLPAPLKVRLGVSVRDSDCVDGDHQFGLLPSHQARHVATVGGIAAHELL